MAPRITKHRIWCKTCNEFELHSRKELFGGDKFPLICETCDTQYSEIKLSEIPDGKLVEQRERYNEQKRKEMNGLFGMFMVNGLNMFNEVDYEIKTVESDAGQKSIDEQKRKEIEKRRNELLQKRHDDLELKKDFHKLGRNEKCLCGSGKKYKKCCWTKIQKI